jgi:phenylacetate-CoA ligase
VKTISSGGSTGDPVLLSLTELENLARVTATYRMLDWFGLDQSLPMVMLRKRQVFARDEGDPRPDLWGFPWRDSSILGDRVFIDVATPPSDQLAVLTRLAPALVNTFPSNILALCIEAERTGRHPPVPAIVSVAEQLTPDIRQAARSVLQTRLIDVLSSSEGGVIAVECPEGGQLHIQSELVIVEILHPSGRPCDPGEVGEITVTPLYNYAMPILRYRSGDFAEQGTLCRCGRTLPTIARFVGRREHLFRAADGSLALPELDRLRISRIVGNLEWQLVQTTASEVEFRTGRTLTSDEQEGVRTALASLPARGWSLKFVRKSSQFATGTGKRHFAASELS